MQDAPPGWVQWRDAQVELGEGEGNRRVVLEGRQVRLLDDEGSVIAQTPDSWLVQCAAVADVDKDGQPELVFLVWKRGSFGTKHPFWVRNEDDSWSQHVFVVRPVESGGEFERVWMSSALGHEVASAELDGAGELVLTDRAGSLTRWYWNSWGFAKE